MAEGGGDGMKKVDFWGKENEVNGEYVESIELAERIHAAVDGVQQDIGRLKSLTGKSVCSNGDLSEQRRLLVGYMEKEAGELEKSLDSYMGQIYG